MKAIGSLKTRIFIIVIFPGPAAGFLAQAAIFVRQLCSGQIRKGFFKAINPQEVRSASVRLASIGPVTSGRMRELGVEPTVQAEYHTIGGLVEAILVEEKASRESP